MGFRDLKEFRFIADSITGSLKTGKDDILNFYGL
jgi:hypothetical protein